MLEASAIYFLLMAPRGVCLTDDSPVAKMLTSSFQNGSIASNTTGKKLKDSATSLGRALVPYSTKSVNNYLARVRRRSDSGSKYGFLALYSDFEIN